MHTTMSHIIYDNIPATKKTPTLTKESRAHIEMIFSIHTPRKIDMSEKKMERNRIANTIECIFKMATKSNAKRKRRQITLHVVHGRTNERSNEICRHKIILSKCGATTTHMRMHTIYQNKKL